MEFQLTLGAGILLAVILVTGVLLKLYTHRRLREIDGVNGLVTYDATRQKPPVAKL